METIEERAAAVGRGVDAQRWLAEFETGFATIAGRFGRVEPRRQARSFLLGLLSDVDSRSCWQLAEQAGDGSPHAMQRLLGEAIWDADAVRDDVRGYVVDALGHPQAVLILDDTGDLKKGDLTVGNQCQYTGTAGRVENAQVAVYLAYATARGSTLIDREVYLPKVWTDDQARGTAAGVPERVRFATKITLGRRMLARALDARVSAAWATADEFYGGDRHLRRDLQARGVGYVLAVAKNHRIITRPVDGPMRAAHRQPGWLAGQFRRHFLGGAQILLGDDPRLAVHPRGLDQVVVGLVPAAFTHDRRHIWVIRDPMLKAQHNPPFAACRS